MTFKHYLIAFLAFSLTSPFQGICREYHVNRTIGSDQNKGDAQHPLKTIQAAAERVQPGDEVIVHTGIYREQVSPVRGGTEKQPIIFRAAPGEKVEIKGSEVMKGWKHIDRHT